LSVRLSTVESELEKIRTESVTLLEKLQQSKSTEDSMSKVLEIEKSKVVKLKQEIERLSAHTEISDSVAQVHFTSLLIIVNYLIT